MSGDELYIDFTQNSNSVNNETIYKLNKKIKKCTTLNILCSIIIFTMIAVIYIFYFCLVNKLQLFLSNTENKIDLITQGFNEISIAAGLIKNICDKPEIAPLCSNVSQYVY